ncbi:CoA transferase [Chelativorans sp. J32]|uniref:CoA transferase n=1 Tax=Chelativorans sp. J32 TaxID=935840 RepID=UPI0004844B54|nr:CoA transferase [Chelativorans sp. J32]
MYELLKGLRIVEGAAFVAAPSCALYCAQMGAEVIRFDMIGGGPDYHRWPRSPNGPSFYWEGLNKGKKSVAIDLSRPEGRELAVAIATAPGENAGLFVTNYPVSGFLSHENLVKHRADMITLRVMGWADGTSAVDYTVNSAVGIPLMTGPDTLGDAPVNHVLPAWDLVTGSYAAFTLLAAERNRRLTGKGEEICVPLGDVAAASLGHLGQVAEVYVSGEDRPRMGNDIFGAFGRDFRTKDGRRVMIVALTKRHWKDLVDALGLREEIAAIEAELGVDLGSDEGLRFQHRDRLNPLVTAAVGERSLAELEHAFENTGVCWGPYNTLKEAIAKGDPFAANGRLFDMVEHPSGHRYPTPGAAATLPRADRLSAAPSKGLGAHTDEVLSNVLGLTAATIGKLHDAGIIAGPTGKS